MESRIMKRFLCFDLIDETAQLLEEYSNTYAIVSSEIVEKLYDCLYSNTREIIGISSRVKTSDSVKEKIIRNELYKKYDNARELLSDLSDMIGIRVECRFIKNELEVLEIIKQRFYRCCEDGYYINPKIDGIALNLTLPQPQMQKNGLPICRIDGIYTKNDLKIRFELQIKSMVNLFWSDIEHSIVYKNNVYMPDDKFIRELLTTIHTSLTSIDNQLQLVYYHMNDDRELQPHSHDQEIQTIIAKIMSDIVGVRMKESIGFTVDFKRSCDILGNYILMIWKNEGDGIGFNSPGLKFDDLTERLRHLAHGSFDLESAIELNTDNICYLDGDNSFCSILGNAIAKKLDNDFEWFMFFKILFEFEPRSSEEDFAIFWKALRDNFSEPILYDPLLTSFTSEQAEVVKEDILTMTAQSLVSIGEIKIIYDDNLLMIKEEIARFTRLLSDNVHSMYDWSELKDVYKGIFMQRIINAVC